MALEHPLIFFTSDLYKTPLTRVRWIFERTKTCTDRLRIRLSVYMAPAEPCKFLNSKQYRTLWKNLHGSLQKSARDRVKGYKISALESRDKKKLTSTDLNFFKGAAVFTFF